MRFYVSSKTATIFARIITIFLLVRVESCKSQIHHDHDQESRMNLAKTEASESESATTPKLSSVFSTTPIQNDDTASSNNNAKLDRSPNIESRTAISRASHQLSILLSSDLISQTNPIQYLIRKTSQLLTSWDFGQLIAELQSQLKTNQFSERYTPYARALQSIVLAIMSLYSLKWNIQQIQTIRETVNVPTEISSPPEFSASGLFSSDVFSDPDPPTQLLNKLMQIPKNDIADLKIRLKNFMKMKKKWGTAPFEWHGYIWYAQKLLLFLKKDYILDDLRRDSAEIQRISIDSQQSLNDNRPNSES